MLVLPTCFTENKFEGHRIRFEVSGMLEAGNYIRTAPRNNNGAVSQGNYLIGIRFHTHFVVFSVRKLDLLSMTQKPDMGRC